MSLFLFDFRLCRFFYKNWNVKLLFLIVYCIYDYYVYNLNYDFNNCR